MLPTVERLSKKYTVTMILKVLKIPRSTYYRWLNEDVNEINDTENKIIELCKRTKYRNGHRKIKALLKKEYNIELNRNTVQRLMQKHNLQCRIKRKRKWKSQGVQEVIVPNVLARDFYAANPNEKWVTDITYIQYGSTTLYLASILDLYNNEIVAYKLYDHQQTPLVMDVLKAALEKRSYPNGVIVHSDQGSVYTSYAYQTYIKEKNLIGSMSRRGNCWDNAVIESFHSNLKTEEFQYVKMNSLSIEEVSSRVDMYIQYYNKERIQQKLGYLTPIEFGQQAA
ncbi:transposase [Ureibacillus massiliensis 4400831 = CIP 108448 = CCUG 49529]|uniref:Transposase n=1 Tax=Ureibacillus massiliensis 4400831 = CIP 108448 = CCUG 49529 TaxID=1211035 RepID=A0A0A3IYP4_9BACL|nr:transposase [Ureibacillus massiliensis 4400831 = CIP 108448 = CCUG 49529]